MTNLNRKREKLLETQAEVKKKHVNPVEKTQYFVPKSSTILQKSLSLSESSSSEDESDPASQKIPTSKFTKVKSKPISSEKKQTKPMLQESPDHSEEEIDFASQLESLAQNFTLHKNEEKKPSPKKSPLKSSLIKAEPGPSTSAAAKNIASLLAQGEGVTLSSSENDTDEEADAKAEEADTKKQNQTEIKNDVISIELPNEGGIRKRKKKGFDMEADVKRQLGRVQRELQMLKHHAHVLCLLSHLRYLNSFAAFPPADHNSAQMLLATALSIIPTAHSVSSKDLTVVRLSSFAAWFKSAFQCLKDDSEKFPTSIQDWLMRAFENYICTSPVQRVILFLLSARSLGWPTRLVLNLDTISTKPEKSLSGKLSEILGASTKKAKSDEKIPQVNGMIEVEGITQSKNVKDGNGKYKSSTKSSDGKESKTKEKKPSKSDKEKKSIHEDRPSKESSKKEKESSKKEKEFSKKEKIQNCLPQNLMSK